MASEIGAFINTRGLLEPIAELCTENPFHVDRMVDLPGTTSCREMFRFLPGWPFQNLLLSPALEDNSVGGVDLATRDSSDPSHAFLSLG